MSEQHWTGQMLTAISARSTADEIRKAVAKLNELIETAAKQGLTVDLSQFAVTHMGRMKYPQLNIEVSKVEHL